MSCSKFLKRRFAAVRQESTISCNPTRQQLGDRKAELIAPLKPDVIATGNPGCLLQLQSSLARAGHNIPVVHTSSAVGCFSFGPLERFEIGFNLGVFGIFGRFVGFFLRLDQRQQQFHRMQNFSLEAGMQLLGA